MKKNTVLLGISCLALTFAVEAADMNSNAANQTQLNNERYDLIRRNQMESTDTLAIPLDDSEVEDEEEINQLERKEVFNLPNSPEATQKQNSQNLPR